MATLDDDPAVGPEVETHDVTPPVPPTVHDMVPVGIVAPEGPVTTATNWTVWPGVGLAGTLATTMVGVALFTVWVRVAEVEPAYWASPPKTAEILCVPAVG